MGDITGRKKNKLNLTSGWYTDHIIKHSSSTCSTEGIVVTVFVADKVGCRVGLTTRSTLHPIWPMERDVSYVHPGLTICVGS
jgi:hypothetical protein